MDPIAKIPVKKTIVFSLISGLIIFTLFKTLVSAGDFSSVIRNVSWPYFFIAFSIMVPITFLGVTRWYLILRSIGYNIPYSQIFKIVITGMSLSLIPGRLGDLARSYPLRNSIPIARSISTIVIEKVVDVSVLIFLSGLGLIALNYHKLGSLTLVIAILAVPSLWILNTIGHKISVGGRLTEKLHDAISVLNEVKRRKRIFSLAIFTSCINWILSIAQVYFIFKSIGEVLPFSVVFAFHPLSTFAGLIPITIAGAGTRDSAIIYFFRNFSTPEQSLAVGILYSLQAYWILGLLTIPLLYYFFKD